MTLRVRISIVPFGNEEEEKEIHQINISNLGLVDFPDLCTYGVELDKYKTGEYDFHLDHSREGGALSLVAKSVEGLLK